MNLHRNNLLGPSIFPPPSMKINSAISHRKFGKDKEKNIEAKPQMLCKMHIFTQWGQTVPKAAFKFLYILSRPQKLKTSPAKLSH